MSCQGCGGALPPKSRKWCSEKCRKASYGDPCVDCGKRTVYGAESKRIPEPRCPECSVEHRRMWTKELVIERIQEWDRVYGEPPAMPDWNPNRAERMNDPERADRHRNASGHWPSAETVLRLCGGWATALEAAGFEPRAPHGGGGNQSRRREVTHCIKGHPFDAENTYVLPKAGTRICRICARERRRRWRANRKKVTA